MNKRFGDRPVRSVLAVLVVAFGLTAGAGAASAATGTAAPSTATADVCGAVQPGYSRCLSVRRTAVAEPTPLAVAPHAAVPDSTPAGYGPTDLTAAYALDPTLGSGQTVALVDAFNNPTAEADLAVYRSQYGLPACTTANGCFRKVNQAGQASPLPANNAGWALEMALDVDMVSAVCPQCNILLVEANSNYNSDLGAAVDTAVNLGAKFVSNSYGGGDSAGYASHYDHPGVAITASTGDNGYGVSFPASAATVTAVGGTSLSRSSGSARGWTEAAWGGAGSGCSSSFAKPAFQANVPTGCATRAVADVSAVADPNTGLAVYNGGWTVVGGTSASSPIVAAVYALAGTPGASDYPNSYPYSHSDSLNDVTTGSNGSCGGVALCTTKTGWDGPTGLGTPDGLGSFSATGVVGPPTKLGATVTITGPVVPGLPSTATVVPSLPAGDAVATVGWKSARLDCTFGNAAAAQTTLTCAAGASGSTTVTATVTDTAGAVKAVTVPVVFATTGDKRAVSLSFGVAGQTGGTESVCLSAASPLRTVVTDVATGLPIKGLPVTFTKQSGTAAAIKLPGASSGADGSAASTITTTTALTLASASTATGIYSAGTAAPVTVTAAKCTPALTATAGPASIYYGDPVTVSGTLTRDGGIPLPGASVAITQVQSARTVTLGTATSGPDGSWTDVVKPTAAGLLRASLPASTSWTATSADAGQVAVAIASSTITGALSSTDVGYAGPVTVSGTLARVTGSASAPVTSGSVSITSKPATGAVVTLGTAKVAADGSWSAVVTPRASGTVSAGYAGIAGQTGAAVVIGAITVGTWTSAVTLDAQYSQQVATAANKITGTVSRSYQGVAGPAPSVSVKVYLVTSTGSTVLLGTAVSTVTGSYSLTTAPAENGTLLARVSAVPGYTDSASDPVSLAVASKIVGTAPSVATVGTAFTVSATVTAARASAVTLQSFDGSGWNTIASGTTAATGLLKLSYTPTAAGTLTLRLTVAGDARGGAGTSATMVVTAK